MTIELMGTKQGINPIQVAGRTEEEILNLTDEWQELNTSDCLAIRILGTMTYSSQGGASVGVEVDDDTIQCASMNKFFYKGIGTCDILKLKGI